VDLSAHNERPEWQALLDAAREAEGRLTFMEIGAGYGRWSARAADVARANDLALRLLAVEAEPSHFAALEPYLRANDVDVARHRVLHAAVGARPGRVPFAVGMPDCYGQRMLTPRLALNWLRRGGRIRLIRRFTLTSLIDGFVDLIDLDIQGSEADVLEAASDALRQNVRRVHIGTHSREIEQQLRDLFTRLDWSCEADFAGDGERETPWGSVVFEDGAQTWRNPLR
jgi:FkbM family methyltransferase